VVPISDHNEIKTTALKKKHEWRETTPQVD